jgi:TrmH family RNA methyltransferase
MSKEKYLSSTSNPIVKKWVRLRTKSSERIKEGSALVPGSQVITELMHYLPPRLIMIRENASLPPPSAPFLKVSDEVMEKITNLPMLPDWIAEFPCPTEISFKGCKRLLILDQIKDPGNLGTIFRSALAFGWDHIFLLEGSADPFGEKALQASKGACFRLHLKSGKLSELKQILEFEKLPLHVAELDGKAPETLNTPVAIALALGSEVAGLSKEISALGRKVSLPMSNATESLNVAVAGAILMYLWRV